MEFESEEIVTFELNDCEERTFSERNTPEEVLNAEKVELVLMPVSLVNTEAERI